MRLDSVRTLKTQLVHDVILPFAVNASRMRSAGVRAVANAMALPGMTGDTSFLAVGARPAETLPVVQRSIALGVAPHGRQYRLAIRVQRASLRNSPMVDQLTRRARGEVDIRLVGRIDKRARARRVSSWGAPPIAPSAVIPWYQRNTRPLLIGASIGHIDVTAGTLGCFVKRGGTTYILSNNHVLANENNARRGDAIIQRADFDGGTHPADDVGELTFFVRLKKSAANFVDAALASVDDDDINHDETRLRELVNGKDRRLAGLGPAEIDEGDFVYKIGRTTGPTKGRVTAFALDNVVVNYDVGNLRFDDQIEIEGVGKKPFSDGGDSGSLIVNSQMEAVALLFAGSDVGGGNHLGLTFANPMHRILQDLKATLLP